MRDKHIAVDQPLDKQDYFRLRRLLLDLATKLKQLPSSIFIGGITCESRDPEDGGAFADIFLGKMGSAKVALKRLRVFRNQSGPDSLNAVNTSIYFVVDDHRSPIYLYHCRHYSVKV